jgi:hypothetical protein
MTFSDFIARIRRFDKNAEMIFDEEEPVGFATDLVMPRRRWFRRNEAPFPPAAGIEAKKSLRRSSSTIS